MRIEEKEGNLVITDFDEMEAYKVAVKIEKDGIEFYKGLSDKVTSDKSRQVFSFLLAEEYRHLKFFEESIFRLRERKEESFEDEDLLSSMDYGIFCLYENIEELKNILNDPRRALKLGIAIEEKSIKLYASSKEHVASKEAKKELSVIIDEEGKHKELLRDMLTHL